MPPIKSLPGLAMRNRYTAHLACVGGCLDYLGLPVSDAWLWGGTGHAFVLNIHKTLCPSGPTAWMSRQLFELANGLGYDIKGVFAQEWVNAEAYAAKQREAWDFARAALDRGLPCYGWEVRPYIPDYFVIPGYDEVGYYYGGYWGDAGGGPTPWETLGTHDVHMVEVYSVEPHPPAAPAQVLRAALTAAVDLAERPNGRIFPDTLPALPGSLCGPRAWRAAWRCTRAASTTPRCGASVAPWRSGSCVRRGRSWPRSWVLHWTSRWPRRSWPIPRSHSTSPRCWRCTRSARAPSRIGS